MRLIKKFLAPKEVKAALGILDEASYKFDSEGFRLVRGYIERMLFSQSHKYVDVIEKGMTPRQWVYVAIANIAGNLVESGNYHIYRGVLNTLGPGPDLLKVFDSAIDELTQISALDAKDAKEQKATIRDNIKHVG